MGVTILPDPKDLKWDNYVGAVPKGSPYDAFTKPSFELVKTNAKKEGNDYRLEKVNIKLTMDKPNCWVKKDLKSDMLLEHERGHWIMYSLIAGEMNDALDALRATNVKTLYQEATTKFDWYRNTRSSFLDNKYDTDTNHGKIKYHQDLWNAKIQEWAKKGKIDLSGPP